MKHVAVQDYYGKVLQSSNDLQTDACCTVADTPNWLKTILSQLHSDVLSRYYGCGLIAPEALDGARVLDLGCGAGRDAYALSAMVGASGHVVGVDMTEEQLAVARAHQTFHAEAFGHGVVNTDFRKGYIEALDQIGLPPASFDVVVSNCVINLAQDKAAVLRGVYDLLKPGGEMYFSDVYADRRIPQELAEDEVLYGECLSGALCWTDFLTIAKAAGFGDPRVVTHRPLTIDNPDLAEKTGDIRFASVTVRLFKAERQAAGGRVLAYNGMLAHAPDVFELDLAHRFPKGQPVRVSGDIWSMLMQSRFAPHFDTVAAEEDHDDLADDAPQIDPFADAATVTGCCG